MAKEMIIELIGGYFVVVDDLNHTLKQKYTGEDKDGNKKEGCERVIGYFPDVQACLERVVRLIMLDESDETVISLREYAELAEKAFDKVKEWRKKEQHES